MEYIIVENGIISKHGCAKTKPENAIEVSSGFAGYIGLPFAALREDLSGLKPLSQQLAEGVIDLPDGYKVNKADNEFIRMEQAEIDKNILLKPMLPKVHLKRSQSEKHSIATGISVTGRRKKQLKCRENSPVRHTRPFLGNGYWTTTKLQKSPCRKPRRSELKLYLASPSRWMVWYSTAMKRHRRECPERLLSPQQTAYP